METTTDVGVELRTIVARGSDERGRFVRLSCGHKVRKPIAQVAREDLTVLACHICAVSSPYRPIRECRDAAL